MTNDKFEKFVRDNKEEFDFLEPSPQLWNKIENELEEKKTHSLNWWKLSNRAAAVVIIFIMSYYVHDFIAKQKESNIAINPEQQLADSIKNEFLETEAYYTLQVNLKLNEVNELANKHPEIIKDIRNDISDLDSIYKGLKSDLNDNIANEEIIEAMIQNYRIKLDILESILNEMKNSSTSKKEKNENDEYNL